MRKLGAILFLTLALSTFNQTSLWAQTARIEVSFEGLRDTNIYLAHYYGSKILRIDSAHVNQRGTATFQRKEEYPQGIYLIYLNKDHYFDFLLGKDQQFTVRATFANQSKPIINGAIETEAFIKYQEFLSQQRIRQLKLQKELELHKNQSDSVKLLNSQIEGLNQEMENYWDQKSKEFKGTFLADFLQSMTLPKDGPFSPPATTKNIDSLRWITNYHFIRSHFWDHFNFAQSGLIRTPLIENKLDQYFKNNLLQIPDSVIAPTIEVIEKAKANEEMYRFVLLNRLNQSISSEVMGMDRLFVILAERYILNQKITWLDSSAVTKIREKVRVTKPNLVGNLAPELKLPDSEGLFYSLRQMEARYTILLFWEPNCSHCKKAVPQLYQDLYLPLKDKGIDIFAVCTQNKKEEWLKAIRDYKLLDWTNVWDPYLASNFRSLYDIYSTPVIYILDAHKRIIAKRLDVESSVKFLKHELGIKE